MSDRNPFLSFLKRLAVILAIDAAIAVFPIVWHVYRVGTSGFLDDSVVVSAWMVAGLLAYACLILFCTFFVVEIFRRMGFDMFTLADENNTSDSNMLWVIKKIAAYVLGAIAMTVGISIPEIFFDHTTPLQMWRSLVGMGVYWLAFPALVIFVILIDLPSRLSKRRATK